MKIGVLSDIHSNVVALQVCLDYLEKSGCEEYFFLGDYVSDTPYTVETMEAIYDFRATHTCFFLRGNREEYMLAQQAVRQGKGEGPLWIPNSASGNLLYTYEQLTKADFRFFESLPKSFRYEKEGYPSITCCHGSVENTRELLQHGGENTGAWMKKVDTDYLICAHTHHPGISFYGEKTYMNAGCVGIAIEDAGYAQCMVLQDCLRADGKRKWTPEFLKLPYDSEKVVEDIFRMGLYDEGHWFINSNIQILLTGIDHAAELVELAGKLSHEAGEPDVWPQIKECYFEEAAKQLGIPEYGDWIKDR